LRKSIVGANDLSANAAAPCRVARIGDEPIPVAALRREALVVALSGSAAPFTAQAAAPASRFRARCQRESPDRPPFSRVVWGMFY